MQGLQASGWLRGVLALALCGLAGLARAEDALRLCGTVTHVLPEATWQAAGIKPGAAGLGRDALVAALFEQLTGLPTSVTYMPSRRCSTETAASRMDGVMGLSALPQRQAVMRYPMKGGQIDRERRLSTFAYHWYARAGTGWHTDGHALTGPMAEPLVGVIEGYSVATLLGRDGYRLQTVSAGADALMRMLAKGRFDLAVLLDIEVAQVLAKTPELAKDVERLEPPYAVRDYYLVLSPGLVEQRPEVAQRLWDAVPKVREITQRLRIDTP
jgi:polar amino acid transport system substrate-binding protein